MTCSDSDWTPEASAAWWAVVESEPVDPWDGAASMLTPVGLVDALGQLQAERSRIAAREAELLRALAGEERRVREVRIDDADGTSRTVTIADEVVESAAVATRQSVGTVRRKVFVARALGRLPRTSAALACGSIGPEHADVIARSADGLPADLVARFESRVLRRASHLSPSQTGSFARRVRAGMDAAGEAARRRAARRHVDVRIWAEDDGLACLQARLPMEFAARLHAALEEGARRVPFDPDESMGQRRVRALIDAVCGTSAAGTGAAATPISMQVTVDLAALLRLSDQPAEVEMPGCGREAVSIDALRELLADPATPVEFRRLVTDPLTGRVIDRGRVAYRVSDALRAFVISRDPMCRFPMCARSARDCDIDHVRPWSRGGRTDASNHLPLCRRHHVLKTHGDWSIIDQLPDGTVIWRAPDGREIVSLPWNPGRSFVLSDVDPPPDDDEVVDPPPEQFALSPGDDIPF